MPTILGHAIAATAAARWWRRMPLRFWVWTAICSMLPDIDVISFAFGIRYEDMFGHRGFTHSFFFAALAGLVAAKAVTRSASNGHGLGVGSWELEVLWIWFTAVTASHGVLDAFT